MAGSITLSLTQQFDHAGTLNAGGQVYFIEAGTVATPQNAYQDLGLTNPWPNPYTLLSDGRIPQLYFADGYIKVRITDPNGNTVFNQDNIPVTGPSSGGGGGGGVDPTTVLQTGHVIFMYIFGVIAGFVRPNGRTIGSASSGATERANADTAALYAFLWIVDPNLVVSGGRGATSAADFAANKTIALPDFRGRSIGGLDDMGNTAAGRLTSTYFGTSAIVLGAAGGLERSPGLLTANLPPFTPSGTLSLATPVSTSVTTTGTASVTSTSSTVHSAGTSDNYTSVAGTGTFNSPTRGAIVSTGAITAASSATSTATPTGTFAGAAQGGVSTPFAVASPLILMTPYMKL